MTGESPVAWIMIVTGNELSLLVLSARGWPQ
jgi:hypothetical protein